MLTLAVTDMVIPVSNLALNQIQFNMVSSDNTNNIKL